MWGSARRHTVELHHVCEEVQKDVQQRCIIYVRKCKWTLLPHPTPPHPVNPMKDIETCKTLVRFSTRRHIHIHTYTYIYITYTYIYIHIHTYTYIYIHSYIHTYLHTCIHAYMHTCIHAYMHTGIHAYLHLEIYIYNYISTMHIHHM